MQTVPPNHPRGEVSFRANQVPAKFPRRIPLSNSCVCLGLLWLAGVAATAQNGLLGEYFNNQNFTGTRVARIDPQIDFDWGQGSPITGIAADTFSVRWTGELVPRSSGTYTLYATSDDGVRLWVNGRRVINGWVPRLITTDTATLTLVADKRYLIQLEFFDLTVSAIVSLAWSSANQPYEIIPATQLFLPAPGANRPPNLPIITAPSTDDLSVDAAGLLLKTDDFSDPDTGNTHTCTQWEIFTMEPWERVWFASCEGGASLLEARLGDGQFEASHAGRTTLRHWQRYVLRVRHRDSSGTDTEWSDWAARPFNTLRPLLTLISPGAAWKYRDDSVDQGVLWRAPNFDDRAWIEGPAPLGFGDGDEATITCCASGNRPITTYFRRSFVMSDPSNVTNVLLRLLRDDGGVVYLNGVEVFRSNLPQSGTILYSTLATSPASDADEFVNYYATTVSPSRLRAGTNWVAVEIHQNSATSSDLSFDLELQAFFAVARPALHITHPAPGCILVSWNEPGFVLEYAAAPAGPWQTVTGPPTSPVPFCDVETARFFRLIRKL